jgi:hypothetical protein
LAYTKPIKIDLGIKIVLNTNGCQKNTKENMTANAFSSHSLQEGLIIPISSPDCSICNTLSKEIHIVIKAVWSYGYMAKIWPFSNMAIFKYGHFQICQSW